MRRINAPLTLGGIATVALLVSSCASEEVLVPHGASAPPGVDFSGIWHIRDAAPDDRRSTVRGVDTPSGKQQRGRKPSTAGGRRDRGGQVRVFLETGSLLKVTQTEHGFFMSLDRSIVEEFRFGENRTVSVGEITARRVSGWEGPIYIVETLDEGGMKLTERFWLSDDRNVLNRQITFRDRKQQESTMLQLFDRELVKDGNRERGEVVQKTRDGTG